MKTSLLLPVFLFFFLVKMQAQAPHVVAVFPPLQKIDAPAQAEITIDFDVAIDPATISNSTVRVFGRWSGPAAGLISVVNDDKQVRFFPTEPFFAGEIVSVSLTEAVKSATGEALEPCYAWNFWIATTPGELGQELVETIELRLPGEGHLQTYGAYAGDMNNDGFSDLVAVNESSDDLRIMMNDGAGSYAEFDVYDFMANSTPSPSEGGDFNNDGQIDVAVTTAWDNEVRVLMGDGMGGFSSQETYFTSNGVRGVVIGDFNGDGWDDMLTTNRLSGDISIFLNDGDGSFTESNMDLPGQDENACAMTDANGDGILDVFYGTYQSQHIGILLGDGNGGFSQAAQLSVQCRPWMVSAGDLNADGHADLAAAMYINNQCSMIAVAFGDGQGGLSAPVHYDPLDYVFPVSIDLGDIDGDGDLDLASSCYSSSNYTIMENDGAGQFTEVIKLSAPGGASCVILHDRDKDGDLDITGTDEVDDLVLLFENFDSTINATIEQVINPITAQISPNPASDFLRIDFFPSVKGLVSFQIFDEKGLEFSSWEKYFPTGINSESYNLNRGLPSGVYFLKANLPNGQIIEKFMVGK